jgi:hypothetical protein
VILLSSNQLLQTVKMAAIEAVEATKPCAVVYGKVKTKSPLTINVDQKLNLTSTFLVVTDSAKDNINAGDTVAMIRIQGGQQYLVLDKVVPL